MSASDGTEKSEESRPDPSTYAEGLDRLNLDHPKLLWLSNFFKTKPEPKKKESTGFVLSLTKGGIQSQPVNRQNLLDPLSECRARVVVLCYTDLWLLDRSLLDDICFVLDVDPFMLQEVLNVVSCRWDKQGIEPDRICFNSYSVREDDMKQLHLHDFHWKASLGAIFRFLTRGTQGNMLSGLHNQRDGHPETLIVFCEHETGKNWRPYPLGRKETSIFRKEDVDATAMMSPKHDFEHWIDDLCDSHDYKPDSVTHPLLLVLPLVRLQLEGVSEFVAQLRHGLRETNKQPWSGTVAKLRGRQKDWWLVNDIFERLSYSRENLRVFLEHHHLDSDPTARALLDDISLVLGQVGIIRDAKKDYTASDAMVVSFEESRKSLQMGESLQKLTYLAFVYVPMSFASSVFGANLQVFGSGNVSVSTFVSVLLGMSVFTAVVNWSWSYTAKGRKVSFSTVRTTWYFVLLFAVRNPLLACPLFLYVFFFRFEPNSDGYLDREPLTTFQLLCALRINYGLEPGRKWDDNEPGMLCVASQFPPGYRRWNLWQKGVFELIHRVALYTSEPGWYNDRFYKPWIRRQRQARLREAAEQERAGISSL